MNIMRRQPNKKERAKTGYFSAYFHFHKLNEKRKGYKAEQEQEQEQELCETSFIPFMNNYLTENPQCEYLRDEIYDQITGITRDGPLHFLMNNDDQTDITRFFTFDENGYVSCPFYLGDRSMTLLINGSNSSNDYYLK